MTTAFTSPAATLPSDREQTPAMRPESSRITGELLRRLSTWVPVAGDEGSPIEVEAPLTGDLLGSVPRGSLRTLEKAASRARRAQTSWAAASFKERTRPFIRLHDLILSRQDEILDLIQLETGKARKHAFEEVADVAIISRYYAHHGEQHLQAKRRKGALPALTATWEYHQPLGLIGFIAPWNYPLSMAVTDAIPALMAGNAVVLKPDQQTPFTALWALDLLYEAGLPADLFQIVTGAGSELGKPMIDLVDFIAFTGSTRTGRIVAQQAAERLIGCSLELGGKNALLVLEDADLDAAVEGALRGCFGNAGQLCISIERIYSARSVHDEFRRKFKAAVESLELNPHLDFSADMGSLISAGQLATVHSHVDDALAKGARLLTGGKHRPDIGPYFYEPTLLEGVTPEMTLFAEETFGPVVSLYSFNKIDEAIAAANDSSYGLNASVWTEDEAQGIEVARRLHAGTVNVNEAYAAAWASVDAPMGGFKDSGLGRRHGAQGILKYSEAQTVAVQRGPGFAPIAGLDEEGYSRVLTQALKVLRRVPLLR